jgi:Protein of unknown function (DUF2752)
MSAAIRALAATRRPRSFARFAPLLALPIPAASFAYTLAFNPTDRIGDPTGPCLWHALFGIDGPTCGLTRLTWYLLHGDFIDAARMHLAAFLLVPIGAYAWLLWAAGWILGRRLPIPRITKPWIIGYAAFSSSTPSSCATCPGNPSAGSTSQTSPERLGRK